jgi:hypothetical protein
VTLGEPGRVAQGTAATGLPYLPRLLPRALVGVLGDLGVEPPEARLRHQADAAAWMRSEVSAVNPACARAIDRDNDSSDAVRLVLTGSGTERINCGGSNACRTQNRQPKLQVLSGHMDPHCRTRQSPRRCSNQELRQSSRRKQGANSRQLPPRPHGNPRSDRRAALRLH